MKIDALKNLNIEPTSALETLLNTYVDEFLTYNAHTNLISKNDEKVLFEKHIYDSLAINKFEEIKTCKNLLDIGTGGGFPSVPIALLFPQTDVYGVDSIAKKINFINTLAKNLNLTNLTGINSRTEDLPPKYRESYDIVTSRAVAPLNVILEYAAPYLKIGGYFVAYKAKIAKDELENAQNAMKILNCKYVDSIGYKLPLEENFERTLIILQKTKPTPKTYPRRAGQATANPLS